MSSFQRCFEARSSDAAPQPLRATTTACGSGNHPSRRPWRSPSGTVSRDGFLQRCIDVSARSGSSGPDRTSSHLPPPKEHHRPPKGFHDLHQKGRRRPDRNAAGQRRGHDPAVRGTGTRRGRIPALRHLQRGRQPLRRRAQHGARALLRLQRQSLPGHPRLRQHGGRHRAAGRGRLCERRLAGLVLRRHELRHHEGLRPVPAAQRSVHRTGRGRGRGRPRRRGERAAGDRRRPQRLRDLRQPRHRLPTHRHDRHRQERPAGVDVHGRQRHPRERRMLLRLRQRRALRRRHRQRPHGRGQPRHHLLLRAVHGNRAVGRG